MRLSKEDLELLRLRCVVVSPLCAFVCIQKGQAWGKAGVGESSALVHRSTMGSLASGLRRALFR